MLKTDKTGVCGICEDLAHGAVQPILPGGPRDPALIEAADDQRDADPRSVLSEEPAVYIPDDRRRRLRRPKAPSLLSLQLVPFIAERRPIPDKLSLSHGGLAAPCESFFYHPVFVPGRQGFELHGLLVELGVEIVDLVRSDDRRVRPLEGLEDLALIAHTAAAEAVDVVTDDRVIGAGLHIPQELPHLWSAFDGVAGDDLLIDLRDGQLILPGELQKDPAVPLQSVFAADGLELQILPAFAEVDGDSVKMIIILTHSAEVPFLIIMGTKSQM